MRKLLYIVFALNLIGVACFCAGEQMRGPIGRQSLSCVPDTSYVLETVGFTLMLPGIFFASSTLLFSRAFALDPGAAFALWWLMGLLMNLILAWRVNVKLKTIANEG
jgi:hypothetical protein